MARSLRTDRGRARHGLAALSVGVLLAGPAGASAPQEQKRAGSELSRIAVHPDLLAALAVPAVAPDGGPTIWLGRFLAEREPNDTPATAQALLLLSERVRGDIYRVPVVAGSPDVDFYSFTAGAGDRVYAATMTAFSPLSGGGGTDTVIDIILFDGTTVLESDNDDGGSASGDSALAGTTLPVDGTYFVRVRPFSTTGSLATRITPYDLHVRVQSDAPTAEIEPNNNGGPPNAPNPVPANGWVSGTVDDALPGADTDVFSVTANAGETIVAILDVDPERNAPEWNARLSIGPFNNSFLGVNGSGVGGPSDDANPAEAHFMTVTTTGTYVIMVEAMAGADAPGNTYNLSVSVVRPSPRTCTTYPGTGGFITDLASTDFTLGIPDLRTIDNLQLVLDATHPASADIDVSLISPDGNEVVLFDDPVNTGSAAPQFNFVIDDEAALPISFGVYNGMHFAPEAFARLAYFKGMEAQGTWTLRVRDDTAGNTGNVNSWALGICEAAPRPSCAVPGPAENIVFFTDFEADNGGFTHTGNQDEWEWGTPVFVPITAAHSGTGAWKTDLDGTYNANANNVLLSPIIDLTAVPVTGRVTLRWWQKFQMESASFDSYYVEVGEVGVPGNSRRIFSWTGDTQTRSVGNTPTTVLMSAGWGEVEADISDFASQFAELRYHVESNGAVQLAGVAIDDVRVSSCTTVDFIFGDGFDGDGP